MKVVVIVLAAGASRRFGSPKLLAPLGGEPLLQHTLDAVRTAAVGEIIVVLGEQAAALEAAVQWQGERRVVNLRPGDGLSSSLRAGLAAAADDPATDGALVVLGDQPRLRAEVIRAVVAAAMPHGPAAHAPLVRVRYDDDDAPNPVLVRRAVWGLTDALAGDRGLGALLAARPELVAEVRAAGGNPDVDTPDDLARLARLD